MSVTPKEFLDSAIELSKSGQDEMTQRNVVSRAYYAVYHQSCALIKPENSDENVGIHRRYINQLMKGDNGSTERRLGSKIKSMYSRRVIADYCITENIDRLAVAIQINAAKDLFSFTEPLEKEKSTISFAESPEKKDDAVGGGMSTRASRPKFRVVK